jgi:hypothetical protein
MSETPGDAFEAEVRAFGDQVAAVLEGAFSHAPPALVEQGLEGRYVVGLERPAPLSVKGKELAALDVSLRICKDSSDRFLAVEKSTFKLLANLDKEPIMRWDYERVAHSKPTAHIQVHGHRGALSHLLSQADHRSPHSMQSLHMPVGGARFRPCLEDVVEFLIADCRFDAKPGWREVVQAGRARWRRLQTRSVVRDMPADAADVLRGLGYEVIPPVDGDPPDSTTALHNW